MKIAILDDYQNAVKDLNCFQWLKDYDVTILTETEKNTILLAEKLKNIEILVLIRERTQINEDLLSKLPDLKLISQTGKIANHLDLPACTQHKVAIAEGIGSPIAPAELTWSLIMNTVRQVPAAIEDFKMVNGKPISDQQFTVRQLVSGVMENWKMVAGYAKAFGAKVLVWGSENSRINAVNDGFESAKSKKIFSDWQMWFRCT